MALPWLQRVELAFFATAFICGAVAAAALTRTQGSFRGSCPLYGVAALNGSSLVLSKPAAPSLCSFVAGASGLLALYCLLLLLFWVYTSCIEGSHRGPIGLRFALATSAIAIFLVLVCACILRFGTSSLCKSIISLNMTSCSDAQKTPWKPPGTAVQFYSNLHNAEVRFRDKKGWVETDGYTDSCNESYNTICSFKRAHQCTLSLVGPQTSSWVNLVLWCVVLVLQVVQWKSEATPNRPPQRGNSEWSSETDALVGPRLFHS